MEVTMDSICSSDGETRIAHEILVGKHLGKWPHERLKRRWIDNNGMTLGRYIVRMETEELALDNVQWVGFDISSVEPSGSITRGFCNILFIEFLAFSKVK